MAGRARRRRARRARSKAAAAAPASAAERPRHPADAAPVVVMSEAAARRDGVAALPPQDWAAVTDVLAAGRPGRCAAGDWPPGLRLFLAADTLARPAVAPDAAPASRSGASAAANSLGQRAAAAAGRPAAVAGPVRPADDRGHRRRAVDRLHSPPSPRRHARKSPSKRPVSEIRDGSTAPTKRPGEGHGGPLFAHARRFPPRCP